MSQTDDSRYTVLTYPHDPVQDNRTVLLAKYGDGKEGWVVMGTEEKKKVDAERDAGRMTYQAHLPLTTFRNKVGKDNRDNFDGGWNSALTCTNGLYAKLNEKPKTEDATGTAASDASESATATEDSTTSNT